MTNNQHNLRVGLVDFADPTLLLLGEASSFNWLAEQIESRCAVVLECEQGSDLSRLSIAPSINEGRISKMETTLEWLMNASDAALFSQQLRQLAASPMPAHIYLDIEKNLAGLQLVASKDEYDPKQVFVN